MAQAQRKAAAARKSPTTKRLPGASKAKEAKSVEVVVDRSGQLSLEELDELRIASGWSANEILDDKGIPTFKGIAALMWRSLRKQRPDLTPQMIYTTPADELGIEVIQAGEQGPTNAAG